MVKEMPSSTVVNRDEECLKKSLMEVVKSDSSNLCRLCLSKEQKLTRAFSDERGIDDALLKKIFDCTTVKVKLKSVFPSAICAVCDLKLNEFYKFREKCIENDTFLHNLLDDRVAAASEVDQSVPTVEKQPKQQHLNRTSSKGGSGGSGSGGTHAKEFQTEQQAATSTTSIPEAQKRNNSEMMAIALNQLSSFGLRPLQELMVERNGTERHALVDDRSSARLPTNSGGNVRFIVLLCSFASTRLDGASATHLLARLSDRQSVSSSSRNVRSHWQRWKWPDCRHCIRTGTEGGSVGGSGGTGAGSTSGGKFECTVCRRMFRNAYTLRRHTNLHTETNLFPCEYCGKKFNDRSNWKIHQRTHTGDNLYTCLVCLKTFISPSTLKYHRRSHRRLESFDCRLCPGTFANYDLLEEHARNMHQDMQDMQPEEPMIDAASFVKIELEDGELSSSMAGGDVGTTTTTRLQHGNEEEEEEEEEEQESRERRQPVDSSGVEELHLAELYQTQQQVLELLEKQLQGGHVTVEPRIGAMAANGGGMGEQTMHEGGMAVKREMLVEHQQQYQQQRQHEVDVKEEPLDDSMEIDPSELLQQAMEEAGDGNEDSEGGDKQFSSSSSDDSSSPSTMILFRCDYCMKIFHFLDELNAHMLLHNGAKKGNAATGPIMLGTAAASNTSGPVPTTPSSKPMPLLTLVRPESSIPLLANGYATKAESKSPRSKPKRRRATTITVAPEEQTKSIPDAVSDSLLPPVAAPPPEHVCSKCPKMFRTEELKRVHEATHADDEQAHKVRSCRICNKLFKCELNLLAHMRKHSLSIHQTGLAGEGAESGAGDSSGNDESCSSSSNVGGGGVLTAGASHELTAAQNHQHFSPDESDEGESPPGAPPSDVASPEGGEPAGEGTDSASLAVLSRSAFRKCEICAITFKDTVALDQHMLCHFERKEAIAFVPQTDRPFQCTECHKSFKRKDYLLIHIRTHTGERRYKCDLCSSAFVHPSNLITHRKLHSNERPYQCTLCGATFKLFAGLKIHRRRCEQKLPKGGSQENAAGTAVLSFGPDTAELHDSGTTAEQLLSAGSVHYPF
uniref:Protein krueppel n=1 Tax=Anopheles coluzzii TaxID=1518534 RepID=A0A8W7PHW0_ANOCL